MSEVHATIGIEQMKKLPDFLESRKRNYLRLEESLRDQLQVRILPQPVNSQMVSSHYCMGALLVKVVIPKT